MSRTEAAQHTPGPWSVNAIKGNRIVGYAASQINNAHAIVATVYRPNDARVIAAVPELLALAERVAGHFEGTDAPLGAAARAAIRKATGQEG